MSATCLVTTLAGTVNDNSLLKVGEHIFDGSYDTSDTKMSLKCMVASILTPVSGDVYVSTSSTKPSSPITQPYTIAARTTYNVWSNGKFKVSNFYDYYWIYDKGYITTKESSFLKAQSSQAGALYIRTGNLSDFDPSNFTTLNRLILNLVTVDTDLMTIISSLGDLRILNLRGCPATYTMSELGAAVSTKLTFLVLTWSTNITGSIESFVAAQRTKGKDTHSGITLSTSGTSVTFNGASAALNNKTLSWTATTITFDGTTINA